MPQSSVSDTSLDDLIALGGCIRQLQIARGGASSWLNLDLTMAQLKALILLVGSGGAKTGDLAARLGIRPSAVTPLVDRLLALKLAVRALDSADRRIVWVRPTTRAQHLYSDLVQASRALYTEILEELPDSERAVVATALAQLASAASRVLQRSEETVPA
jgi:DNA-binding MarR family transcriptional regulator